MICKNCGNALPEGARFCVSCGTDMQQAQSADPGMQAPDAEGQKGAKGPAGKKAIRCAGCGAELRAGAEFCLYCGRRNCVTIPAWIILLAISLTALAMSFMAAVLHIGVWGVYCSLVLLGICCLKTRGAVIFSIFAGVVYGGTSGIFTWQVCEADPFIQGIPRKYTLGCFLLAVGALAVWSMAVKLIQARVKQGSYLFLVGVMGTVPLMQFVIWRIETLLAAICEWKQYWLSLLEIWRGRSGLIPLIILQMICSGVVIMVYLKKMGSDFRVKVTYRIK